MIRNRHPTFIVYCLVLACLIGGPALAATDTSASSEPESSRAATSTVVPPADPRQSITFWKKHALADDDPAVVQARDVFSVLLRAWDSSRIEPALYVVESDAGAWAASLADGNILISKQAVDVSLSSGKSDGDNRLAFVLAHELAHQRADDLWHQRFFRVVARQPGDARKVLLHGLTLDDKDFEQLQEKEAQADHDGILLMRSVGYDPYKVIDQQDFFTHWVESIWQQHCDRHDHNTGIDPVADACALAKARALRTRVQLENVASQSVLYEMGIQAFVAGNMEQARAYFTSFGRDFPSRAVISAIATTHIMQAEKIAQQIDALDSDSGGNSGHDFYYPVIIDAKVDTGDDGSMDDSKRGDVKVQIKQLRKARQQHLDNAVHFLEKALQLAPDYKLTYLLLASSYLLADNTYSARGVLQGQYLPRFGNNDHADTPGQDMAVSMLLALTSAMESDRSHAIATLEKLSRKSIASEPKSMLPANILRYSLFYNLAYLYRLDGDNKKVQQTWMTLIDFARSSGDSLLFRLALSKAKPDLKMMASMAVDSAPALAGFQLGDRIHSDAVPDAFVARDFWIDGEKYRLLNKQDDYFITDASGNITNAWNTGSESSADHFPLKTGDSADRPYRIFGIPDRELNLTTGNYLAYDSLGIGIRIIDNRVGGWFLYDRH